MRLIDADKIIFAEIDEVGGEYEPYLGCSKSQINHLPTVKAIPLDRVEQIREHFEVIAHFNGTVKADYVLRMLDKAIKEQNE